MYRKSIFWFRRDLRLHDNTALLHALRKSESVQAIFIFDEKILSSLTDKFDRRLSFIYKSLMDIKQDLNNYGSDLKIYFGSVMKVFSKILSEMNPDAVFTNRDYEPYAVKRDISVFKFLESNNVAFHHFKDQVIFEVGEILTNEKKAFHVFSAYKKSWLKKITEMNLKPNTDLMPTNRLNKESFETISLEQIGFNRVHVGRFSFEPEKLENYKESRDIPSLDGTSQMSVALRFGTISIREISKWAYHHNHDYLSELIWREFFMMLLAYYPESVNSSFREKYREMKWKDDKKSFDAWKNGETGVPIVDAGMRELNETGLMHNRVRMITASFLVKNLHIDWRIGERYFAEKLFDFELSSNVGNWQWVAGTGVDAAPYFRVLNPIRQQERFDRDFTYIKKWIKDFEEKKYLAPIVDLKESSKKIQEMFKSLN